MATVAHPTPTVELLTQAGIAALRAGDKARSRELLKQALQIDPFSVNAWLWLSGGVDSDASRRRCLRKVLEIDPTNAAARRGLTQLGEHVRPLPQPSSITVQTVHQHGKRSRLVEWLQR